LFEVFSLFSLRRNRNLFSSLLLLLVVVLSHLAVQNSYAKIPFSVDGQQVPSLAPMLERTQPAVVNISTIANVRVRAGNPFFRRYFDIPSQSRNEKRQGLGSGVIINARLGLIVTNSHVIDKVDEINVTLKDGREFSIKKLMLPSSELMPKTCALSLLEIQKTFESVTL